MDSPAIAAYSDMILNTGTLHIQRFGANILHKKSGNALKSSFSNQTKWQTDYKHVSILYINFELVLNYY